LEVSSARTSFLSGYSAQRAFAGTAAQPIFNPKQIRFKLGLLFAPVMKVS
jgi:hypothetical protein